MVASIPTGWPKPAGIFIAMLCALFVFGSDTAEGKRKPDKVHPLTSQIRGVNLSLTRAFATGPYALSDEADAREMQSACQLGARVVRVMVTWHKLESGWR